MRRITVAIEEQALSRLRALAEAERRDPRDQAAVLLAAALRRAERERRRRIPATEPPQ
jgi:hypothetical protein